MLPATFAPDRLLAGVLLSGLIAGGAWRARALATSGMYAAVVLGSLTTAAGWGWAILLIVYFVASSLVSRLGGSRKVARAAGVVAKGGARDAWQVVSNGGVFGGLALLSAIFPHTVWWWGGVGALAASAADTWATEVGMLSRGQPRMLGVGPPVATGTSGGMSWMGLLGATCGAALVGAAGWVLTRDGSATGTLRATVLPAVAVTAGLMGMFADSVLGAVVQERRRCPSCGSATEQRVHSCGTYTQRSGGVMGITNDTVNVLATCVGALVGMGLYAVFI